MKPPKLIRGKFADEAIYGPEPELNINSTTVQISDAYSWYRYFFDDDGIKKFAIAYLTDIEWPKEKLEVLKQLPATNFSTAGLNCRILHNGSYLPAPIVKRMWERLELLSVPEVKQKEVSNKEFAGDTKQQLLIGSIETEIDTFLRNNKHIFDTYAYLTSNNVAVTTAKTLTEYYSPLLSEINEYFAGDEQVVESYSKNHTKKSVRLYQEFVQNILDDVETFISNKKKTASPRKTKIKTADQLTRKLKYLDKDDTLKLVSVKPTTIVGSTQVWTFSPKNKLLGHYVSDDGNTLTIKGSVIVGYNASKSLGKRLRKPELTLKEILESGKIAATKLFDGLKTKSKPLNGRINNQTLLLRTIK